MFGGFVFEAGSGIVFKEVDGKTLICADVKTRIKETNFLLEGDHVEIRAGQGVKIQSIHPNIIVVSVDTTKQDERIYNLQQEVDKRLETIETIFLKIVKDSKK